MCVRLVCAERQPPAELLSARQPHPTCSMWVSASDAGGRRFLLRERDEEEEGPCGRRAKVRARPRISLEECWMKYSVVIHTYKRKMFNRFKNAFTFFNASSLLTAVSFYFILKGFSGCNTHPVIVFPAF